MKNDGFSLLETLVGLSLLLVVAAGMMPLATVAFSTSENQGHLASRAAECAQDKLEQLMALSYGDSVSDTRVFSDGCWRQRTDHRWRPATRRLPVAPVRRLSRCGRCAHRVGKRRAPSKVEGHHQRVWRVSTVRLQAAEW